MMEKGKQLSLAWIVIGVVVMAGLLLIVGIFAQNWPNMAIADLPLLFWILFVVFVGTLLIGFTAMEVQAWRKRVSISDGYGNLLTGIWVFVLLVALLLGPWNGAKLIMVSVGTIIILKGISSLTRRIVFASPS